MLGHVHHVGYRVGDLEFSIAEYSRLFRSAVVSRFNLPDGSPAAFLTLGPIQVELIQNAPDPGQHLDHIAYAVDDLDIELADLAARGVEFATEQPVVSGSGHRFIFANVLGSRIQILESGGERARMDPQG